MDYPKSVANVGLVDGKFVDENTASGVVGSLIPAEWGNLVTDELLAVIKAAGLTPSETDATQLLKAIRQTIVGNVTGGLKNKLINAGALINQRGYVSGTATTAAGQYTLDRWRVVTSGQALTFATSGNAVQMTAPAGGIEQVVEGSSVEAGTYCLTWTGTATATVNGTAVANGGVIALAGAANVTVRFIGGTVFKPQLACDLFASKYEERPLTLELILCQRYYEKSYDVGVAPGANSSTTPFVGWSVTTTSIANAFVQYKVPKRAAATLTYYSVAGNVGKTSMGGPASSNEVAGPAGSNYLAGVNGFELHWGGGSLTTGGKVYQHWTADCEI